MHATFSKARGKVAKQSDALLAFQPLSKLGFLKHFPSLLKFTETFLRRELYFLCFHF